MRRAAHAVLVAVLMVPALLAGCSQEQVGAGTRLPSTTASAPSAPGGAAPSSAGLAQAKKVAGIAGCPATDDSAVVPGGLPDVELPCLGGGRAVRLAGLRGRPLLVNVWAQWCGPCRTEAPVLAQVARADADRLLVLGVDYADPLPDRAIEFARVSGWRYPQVSDQDKALTAPLRLSAVPQTFFVRADGTIAYRHSGPFTSTEELTGLLAQHLGLRR